MPMETVEHRSFLRIRWTWISSAFSEASSSSPNTVSVSAALGTTRPDASTGASSRPYSRPVRSSGTRSGMMPAERRIALRSQPMPKSSSRTPMTSCRLAIGIVPINGPMTKTIRARTRSAAPVPRAAGRQPRSVPTTKTIVNASTTSTTAARKADPTAGAAVDQGMPAMSIAWRSALTDSLQEHV